MCRMQKHNLCNIKRSFEKKTGTRLIPAGNDQGLFSKAKAVSRKRIPKAAVVAAIITLFATLTAFAVSIFSTRFGDSLTMTASYYGRGIV